MCVIYIYEASNIYIFRARTNRSGLTDDDLALLTSPGKLMLHTDQFLGHSEVDHSLSLGRADQQ